MAPKAKRPFVLSESSVKVPVKKGKEKPIWSNAVPSSASAKVTGVKPVVGTRLYAVAVSLTPLAMLGVQTALWQSTPPPQLAPVAPLPH